MAAGLRGLGLDLPEGAVRQLTGRADADGDGRIDAREFRLAFGLGAAADAKKNSKPVPPGLYEQAA